MAGIYADNHQEKDHQAGRTEEHIRLMALETPDGRTPAEYAHDEATDMLLAMVRAQRASRIWDCWYHAMVAELQRRGVALPE